jgi:sugar phosphate isomerase/epimerase
MTRREAIGALAVLPAALSAAPGAPTKFQLGCMTLPYSAFPLQRALEGIKSAGYDHVAWGTTHQNSPGRRDPVMAPDAPAAEAKKLGERCRSMGLQPIMMFSQIYVAHADSVAVHTRRIEQAAAAGIPIVLTFGEIKVGAEDVWIKNLKQLGPIARQNNVLLTIKQHGGNTATGKDCARIVQQVNDPGIKMTYDAATCWTTRTTIPLPISRPAGRRSAPSASKITATRRRIRTVRPAWARSITTSCSRLS